MNSGSTASANRTLLALLCIAAFTGGLAVAHGAASAKKRVVILDFSGPRSSTFEKKVTALVKKRNTLISESRYIKTSKKLKATKPSSRNVSRVARDLGVDAVVIGSVKRRGTRYELKVRIRAGATGEFVDTITVKTRRPTLSGSALAEVREGLEAAFDQLPSLDEAEAGDDDDDDDRVSARGDDDDDDDGERIIEEDPEDDRGGNGGDDDDDRAGELENESKGDAAIDITDEEKSDLLARGRGMEIMAGLSFMGRKLSFSVDNTLGELAPRGYSGTPVAGAYIVGELYPMAFNLKNKGTSRNIGVIGVLDKVLKIESKFAYTDAMMVDQVVSLPTEQQRWGIGVVYRYNLGKGPTKPTIKAAIRYNRAKFIIDKGAAPADAGKIDIPNMDYTYYDPGVALRYPVSPKLALQADARFLFVTDTGEMQQVDQYGGATVTGFDVDAGLEYKVDPRLFIRAGGRIIGVAYDFKGTGAETTDRDADAEQDVFGALDRYTGGYVTAGYLF